LTSSPLPCLPTACVECWLLIASCFTFRVLACCLLALKSRPHLFIRNNVSRDNARRPGALAESQKGSLRPIRASLCPERREIQLQETKDVAHLDPITLTAPFLLSVILIAIGLIVLVVWLLRESNADQGILFAPNINDLPLRKSFLYLYLPTLVSVIYSFLWTWIDLDVKRLEPFFQLPKPGGASAENSILLHYPFDILAMVPIKALKRKHWSVFASSMIMVLIFWGLTPTQYGLFAVRTITVTEDFSTKYAEYTHIDEQGSLSALYAQSVFNIAWLNESLPSFMTKDLMLAPFGPHTNDSTLESNASYTGYTTSYSLDLICEPPTSTNNGAGIIYYESINGCNCSAPSLGPVGANDIPSHTALYTLGTWARTARKAGISRILPAQTVSSQDGARAISLTSSP